MATGIANTLAVIAVVRDLAVRLVGLAKSPSIITLFTDAPALFNDVATVAGDATLVVPELAGLDMAEVEQLGTAAFGLVTAVVNALKA